MIMPLAACPLPQGTASAVSLREIAATMSNDEIPFTCRRVFAQTVRQHLVVAAAPARERWCDKIHERAAHPLDQRQSHCRTWYQRRLLIAEGRVSHRDIAHWSSPVFAR